MQTDFIPVDPAGFPGLSDQLDKFFHGGVVKDHVLHQPLLGDQFGVLYKVCTVDTIPVIIAHTQVNTIDRAFDSQAPNQPLALHTAFPLFEVVPVEGEVLVPFRQLFVAPLAHVQPGGEPVHDDVADRGVHQLANQTDVASCSFKQPELKPDILNRPGPA